MSFAVEDPQRPIAVAITRASKSFPSPSAGGGSLRVLDDVSLDVRRGEFVSVVGPSGCGKTTLLRIVAGLVQPDTGEVRVRGELIHAPGQDTGFVFQRYGLLPWRTVLGNVELGLELRGVAKELRREKAADVLDRLGLNGFGAYYPSQLSGGMQQRVALARALVRDPGVLLMDEPFAAVDFQTREDLQQELMAIWETIGTTVIFVTHSIDEAVYLGDRVIVMASRPGRCVGDLTVPLPRPRNEGDVRSTAEFAQTAGAVRKLLARASGTENPRWTSQRRGDATEVSYAADHGTGAT